MQNAGLPNRSTVLESQTYHQLNVDTTYHCFTFAATSSTATVVIATAVFGRPSSVNTLNSDLVLTQANVMTMDEATRYRTTALVLDLDGRRHACGQRRYRPGTV